MMREYEIVFWVALNSQKDIEGIILKNARSTDPETKIISAIRSRLILTAYTTKCELSDKKTEEIIKEFYLDKFPVFVSEHTSWVLLDEPQLNKITPCILNKVRIDLLEIYNKEISKKEIFDKNDDVLNCDLNQVVNKLEEFTEGHKGKQGRRKKATDISEMLASS
jgi:hypothetical protein